MTELISTGGVVTHPHVLLEALFWIAMIALMARRYQTKRQTTITIAIWAVLVLSGAVFIGSSR